MGRWAVLVLAGSAARLRAGSGLRVDFLAGFFGAFFAGFSAVLAGLADVAPDGLDRSLSRSASTRVGTYGAGSGSRSSRFILSSLPARSAATASGS